MIIFTANGTDYNCPDELKDITFERYAKYMEISETAPSLLKELSQLDADLLNAEKLTDEELDKKLKRIDTLHNKLTTGQGKKEYIEFKMRVVSHFTGLDIETMQGRNGINIEGLNTLYSLITNALDIRDVKEFEGSVEINGELYTIATNNNITLGEWLEAAQIEELNAKLGNAQYQAMIDICSVLLRKEGEEYSDEIYKRNKETFAKLDMQTVASIAFFFLKTSEQQLQIVTLSLLEAQVENLKAARRNALDGILSLQA